MLKRILLLLIVSSGTAFSKIPEQIDAVLVHPLFEKYYVCAEHTGSQDWGLGDSLGADCIVHEFVEEKGLKWLRSYKNKGINNTDWFGWRQSVLAPISGKVVNVHTNEKENLPGKKGSGIATMLVIERSDGLKVSLAHLQELKVKKDDLVKAGQAIGLVGNNGQSWHPHIHIGAWKDKTPLQVRFDQHKIRME